jgi:hypothetical protein
VRLVDDFNKAFGRILDRSPKWVSAVVIVWLLGSATLYFGSADLSWMRPWLWVIVMAPPLVLVSVGLISVAAHMVDFVLWPFRRAAEFWRKPQ